MSTRLGRPTVAIVLSDDERETLERWARRPTSAQALALRCRIVLAAAQGTQNKAIARALGCHPVTVGKWRRRFAQRRLDGLSDEPRPGAPRTISDAQIEAVIVKTLEEQPHNATQWSTRSMASAVGMSQTAISKIWRAFGLKPHLREHFKLSPDPQFIDKVRDVAGLYLNRREEANDSPGAVSGTTRSAGSVAATRAAHCAPLPDAGTGAPALPTLTDAAGAHRATGRQPQRPGDGGRAVRESHRAALRGAQALGRDPR